MVVCGCGVQDGEGGSPGPREWKGADTTSSSRMGKADGQSEQRAREDQVHGQFQQGLGPGCGLRSGFAIVKGRQPAGLLAATRGFENKHPNWSSGIFSPAVVATKAQLSLPDTLRICKHIGFSRARQLWTKC